MKVADSSFLIEALLRDAGLLENETFIAPDLALYEIVNTLWKHEILIRDIEDAHDRIALFADLISSQTVQLLRPDRKLLDTAYALSVKNRTSPYDTIFVALALQLGLDLRTFDDKQAAIISAERHGPGK